MSHVFNEVIAPARSDSSGDHPPQHFLWRGRIYLVREVLSYWIESDSWWSERADGRSALSQRGAYQRVAEVALPSIRERRIWRVEAQSSRSTAPGIYDVCLDVNSGAWSLVRAMD